MRMTGFLSRRKSKKGIWPTAAKLTGFAVRLDAGESVWEPFGE